MKVSNLLYKRLKRLIAVSLMFTSWSLINPTRLIYNSKIPPLKNPLVTQRVSTNHQGVDLVDRMNNKNVYSITRCRVTDKGFTGNKTPYITYYDSENQIYYKYLHITSIFERNQILDVGDIIGEYNNEGKATGFHLHLEVYDKKNNFYKDGLKEYE